MNWQRPITGSDERSPLDPHCFGFYFGSNHVACADCTAARRCKAVLVSDGFQILGELVDQLTTELPPGNYKDQDRVRELVKTLISPDPVSLSKEEEELLGLLNEKEKDALADLDL